MDDLYTQGSYLDNTKTWHAEDAPWKAQNIYKLLQKHALIPTTVAEVGCGSGEILVQLSNKSSLRESMFFGFDISPQAYEISSRKASRNIKFFHQDLFATDAAEPFDLLLAIDVFEHVPDYFSFLKNCRDRAKYRIFHIPLDLHVSAIVRNSFLRNRYTIGHIHYFTAESALAALRDCGHEIVDFSFTNSAIDLYREHPSLKTAIGNVFRRVISLFGVSLAARFVGGYSLLVLCK